MFGWYWLADACQAAGLTFVLAHALYVKAIHGGKNKNDRIDSEKLTHLLRSNLIPPAYVYPAEKRPLRALLRQCLFYVWRRAELLARNHSHQLAHNRTPAKPTRRIRDPWEEQLLAAEEHPLRQIALKNDLAMIRHFDHQIFQLEEELQRQTRKIASREFALLQTVPGIGENLGLTILYEIGDIARFPTVKDFLSYCRLVKGAVASAGKIKGLRGAKLGNPYLCWALGEAAVIAKRDHQAESYRFTHPHNDQLTDRRRNQVLAANPTSNKAGTLKTEARGGGSVQCMVRCYSFNCSRIHAGSRLRSMMAQTTATITEANLLRLIEQEAVLKILKCILRNLDLDHGLPMVPFTVSQSRSCATPLRTRARR